MQLSHALPRVVPRRVAFSIVRVQLLKILSSLLAIVEFGEVFADDADPRRHKRFQRFKSRTRVAEQVQKLKWHDAIRITAAFFYVHVKPLALNDLLLDFPDSLLKLLSTLLLAAEKRSHLFDPPFDQLGWHRVVDQRHSHVKHFLVQWQVLTASLARSLELPFLNLVQATERALWVDMQVIFLVVGRFVPGPLLLFRLT